MDWEAKVAKVPSSQPTSNAVGRDGASRTVFARRWLMLRVANTIDGALTSSARRRGEELACATAYEKTSPPKRGGEV